jgi:hypothetical protein
MDGTKARAWWTSFRIVRSGRGALPWPSAQYRFPANYSNNLGARRRALHFCWQFA